MVEEMAECVPARGQGDDPVPIVALIQDCQTR